MIVRFRIAARLAAVAVATVLGAPLQAQRGETAGVGTTARVLVIGAHPDDEDNALIAWLSLGRHVETAYLSLTRGEHGLNVLGRERESLLGMVRTAEMLEERKRDGARQFFTRAYDFGHAKNDSVLDAAWPHDSLLDDVATVVRVFRPQVIIALFAGDSTERDLQHRTAGRLAREAYALAGDTVRLPAARTSLVGAWQPDALYQLVDSGGPSALRIDVGELDARRGRTYAEIGAEVRRFQRTQPALAVPPVGPRFRYLHLDSLRDAPTGDIGAPRTSLFPRDTSWSRFSAFAIGDTLRAAIDSIATLSRSLASTGALAQDTVVSPLADVVRLATRARAALSCSSGGLRCAHGLGDLASSLETTGQRASHALLDALGVVIDVSAEREAVAVGDSVPVTVTVFNGGSRAIDVTRVFAGAAGGGSFAKEDTTRVQPGTTHRWTGDIRMFRVTHPWWITAGLASGTWLYALPEMPGSRVNHGLVAGEDRMLSTRAEVTVSAAGAEVTKTIGPIIARDSVTLRGDDRHPLAGVPRLGVLLERGREYARANVPFERLYRVWVGSSVSHADTVRVAMTLPSGLHADSATRSVALAPFGSRTLFFRVRGTWPAAELPIHVSATAGGAEAAAMRGTRRDFSKPNTVSDGLVAFEYPHIPTQRLPVSATDSVLAVSLRVPPTLRVAFVRGRRDDQLDARLAELGIEIYPIDAAAIGATDLSAYSTILIAPRAWAEVEALQANAAAVQQFARQGGTVLVLFGTEELTAPGVLPYPVAFGATDSTRATALDPDAPVHLLSPSSPLLSTPNRITSADFVGWVGARAIELPVSSDNRYRNVLEVRDDAGHATDAAILAARVGRGMFIYTGLALDQQIERAANAGAARLIVNLMAKR
jgi:LmbE family N-acetylglucosaminyl deacetylase